MLRRTLTACVLTIGLVAPAVACSGDDSDSSRDRPRRTTTTTTTAPPASTTTTVAAPAPTGSTAPPLATSPPATPVDTCGDQRALIVAVIEASDDPALTERRGRSTVQQCRLASGAPIWARAEVVPNPGESLGAVTVVVARLGSIWSVYDAGTAGVGCQAPPEVIADLQLSC